MFNARTYTGADGILTLSNPVAIDAGQFTNYFGADGAVGRVTNVTLDLQTEIRPFHSIGSRAPNELRAGNIFIRGTVERAFINGALLRLMLGGYAQDEETAALRIPTFDMTIVLDNLQPEGEAGNATLTLYGVMFDSWKFGLPEDDFVLEKLSFHARRITTEDTEVPA